MHIYIKPRDYVLWFGCYLGNTQTDRPTDGRTHTHTPTSSGQKNRVIKEWECGRMTHLPYARMWSFEIRFDTKVLSVHDMIVQTNRISDRIPDRTSGSSPDLFNYFKMTLYIKFRAYLCISVAKTDIRLDIRPDQWTQYDRIVTILIFLLNGDILTTQNEFHVILLIGGGKPIIRPDIQPDIWTEF